MERTPPPHGAPSDPCAMCGTHVVMNINSIYIYSVCICIIYHIIYIYRELYIISCVYIYRERERESCVYIYIYLGIFHR